MNNAQPNVRIVRYADLICGAAPWCDGGSTFDTSALDQQLDRIFFEASNTKIFPSPEARDAFRERWLGRYLAHDPQWAYVALSQQDSIAGYLVGALADPARAPRFRDVGYFARFAELTRRFPAHLHVNLTKDQRGAGIGGALVARFCADAARAGSPGVHVVTSRGARNVGFYARQGFAEKGSEGEGLKEIVFLARVLQGA